MEKVTNQYTGESWEIEDTKPSIELKLWVTPFRFLGHLEMEGMKAEVEFEIDMPLIDAGGTLDKFYPKLFDLLLMSGSQAASRKDE